MLGGWGNGGNEVEGARSLGGWGNGGNEVDGARFGGVLLSNGDVRALFGLSWREAGVRLLPLLRKSSSSIPKSGSRG